jgi:formylglycine-generating enzyme required for sulfatase activity
MPLETPEAAPIREFTNTIGIPMVPIAAGEFLMGGIEPAENVVRMFPTYEKKPEDFADEYPRHRVRITQAFFLAKYEVTVGQYRQFLAESGYSPEPTADGQGGWGYDANSGRCVGRRPEFGWDNPGYRQTEQHPVVDVTWNDATAFCQWLSRKEHKLYRLPTEAEWEYSNRAGSTTRYASGDDPTTLVGRARVIDQSRHPTFQHVQDLVIEPGDPSAFPMPVGSLQPNAWGLYDMQGNVWEWTTDWYGEDYYAMSPTNDPQGPPQGEVRVRRGGGWNSFPLWTRASFRNWNRPDSRCVNLGFRVAMNR